MKSFCFGIICFLAFNTCYGQAGHPMSMPNGHAVVVPRSPYYRIPVVYQLHDGVARLTDGSLLRGRFLYNKVTAFNYYENGHSPGKLVRFYEIDNLTLAGADSSVLPRTDSTVFARLTPARLFRRLTIGKVGLYDEVYAVNEDKGKLGDVLYTWSDDGKLRRLRTLEKVNQWFYEVCGQNHWSTPDVFLSKSEIIKRLAQLDPVP